MRKEEVVQILTVMQTAYPRFYANQTNEDIKNAIDLWSEMFVEDDVRLVVGAVKQLITSSPYPPTIADVKEKMYSLTNNEVDNMELWNELDKAVRNCLYNTQQVFDGLSPLVKKFVGSPAQLRELATSDTDTFCTVTKGQFLKQIEVLKKRDKEEKMMLPENKKLLEDLASKLVLLE